MSTRPGGELTGLVVLVTGATGAAGRSTVRALAAAGADVVAVGRDERRLAALFSTVDGVFLEVADLTDRQQCEELADRIRAQHHRIDGLVHLVGGWRGAPQFTANSDDDWAFLSRTLIDGLRHITLAVHDDLAASADGRAVIVSATAVDRPTPGGANYAAAKAATEGWMGALAESFVRVAAVAATAPHAHAGGEHTSAAATVLVIKALVDDAMRDASPDKSFDGFPMSTFSPPASSRCSPRTPANSTEPASSWARRLIGRTK